MAVLQRDRRRALARAIAGCCATCCAASGASRAPSSATISPSAADHLHHVGTDPDGAAVRRHGRGRRHGAARRPGLQAPAGPGAGGQGQPGADRRGGPPYPDDEVPGRAVRASLRRRRQGRRASPTSRRDVALARQAAQRSHGAAQERRRLAARPCQGRPPAGGGDPTPRDTPIGGYSSVPKHVVSVLEGMRDRGQGHRRSSPSPMPKACASPRARNWNQDQVELEDPAVNARLIAEAVDGGAVRPTPSCWCWATTSRPAARAGPRTTSATGTRSTSSASRTNSPSAILALHKPTVVLSAQWPPAVGQRPGRRMRRP